jgi:hypothetical protein
VLISSTTRPKSRCSVSNVAMPRRDCCLLGLLKNAARFIAEAVHELFHWPSFAPISSVFRPSVEIEIAQTS